MPRGCHRAPVNTKNATLPGRVFYMAYQQIRGAKIRLATCSAASYRAAAAFSIQSSIAGKLALIWFRRAYAWARMFFGLRQKNSRDMAGLRTRRPGDTNRCRNLLNPEKRVKESQGKEGLQGTFQRVEDFSGPFNMAFAVKAGIEQIDPIVVVLQLNELADELT